MWQVVARGEGNPYPEASSKTETELKSDVILLQFQNPKRIDVFELLMDQWNTSRGAGFGHGKALGGRVGGGGVDGRKFVLTSDNSWVFLKRPLFYHNFWKSLFIMILFPYIGKSY